MVNALRVTDPTLNTSLGTPIRKMLSAVASELARLSQDQVQTTSLYSLDALSGSDLDALVAQFGFTRQVARAARGYVKITRDNGDSVWAVPYGTQFWRPATSSTASIGFSTMAYAEMAEGVLSCEVSVCAVQAGSAGNVPADTVTLSSPTGYVPVPNPAPTPGGRSATRRGRGTSCSGSPGRTPRSPAPCPLGSPLGTSRRCRSSARRWGTACTST